MRAWLLVTLLVLAPTGLQAFTSMDKARAVRGSIGTGERYASPDQRRAMARAILAYWTDFDAKLPRLPTDETARVAHELQVNDPAQLTRLVAGRPYHLWELAGLVDRCIDAANALIVAQADPPAQGTEMAQWLRVAACYHRSDGATFPHLKAAGLDLVSDFNDGDILDGLILTLLLTAVIPSAMADTMEWPGDWPRGGN